MELLGAVVALAMRRSDRFKSDILHHYFLLDIK